MNNKTLPSIILGASLAACAAPGTQTPPDLVVLPADATQWRILVGHWENQVELTGSSVAVPSPTAEYARNSQASASAGGNGGVRESVQFQWKDLWQSQLRFESRQPLDLRPYLAGTLEFELDIAGLPKGSPQGVAELMKGAVKVKLSCGNGCERAVSLLEPSRAWIGKGPQHVALPMSCFVRDGADFSRVSLPFSLEGTGSGRVTVSNVRISAQAKAGLPCPDYRTESVTPAMLEESWAVDWWLPRHREKLEEKRKLVEAGTPPQLVFIGDSITQGWEKEGREVWQSHYARYNALDLGFGGDRTENVLWRLQNGEIDGIAPKVAVLMIGTNNTGHRVENPETTAAGVRRLIEEIRHRLPGTKVLLLGVFPRGEKPDDHLRGLNERVNRTIAGYADGRKVRFLDIGRELLNADGSLSKDIMPDLLHPNEKGYAIWQRAMDPVLQELLGQP